MNEIQCFGYIWIIPMSICFIMMFLFFIRGFRRPGFMCFGDRFYKQDHINPENPIEIVKRRYANGDITKAEYDQLIDDMRK